MNHWQWPSPFAQIMKSVIDLVPGDSCQKCGWCMVCLFYRNVYGAISPKGGSKPVSLVTRLEPLCDLSLSTLLEERGSLFTNPLFSRYWPVDGVIVCSSEKARKVDQGSGLISLAGTGRVCGGPIAGVCLWFSFLLFTQHSFFSLWVHHEATEIFVPLFFMVSWANPISIPICFQRNVGINSEAHIPPSWPHEVPAYLLTNIFPSWLFFLS